MKRIIKLSLPIVIIIFYFLIEYFLLLNKDFGCGCSSGCIGSFPTKKSITIGHTIILVALTIYLGSSLKSNIITTVLKLFSIIMFVFGVYGNSYLIYDKGFCGEGLYKRIFLYSTKIGDYATNDGLNLEYLKNGKLKGKMLGFIVKNNNLTIFRINETPLKLKTSFLFWKTDINALRHQLNHRLGTIPLYTNQYEFIGGKDMKKEDFVSAELTIYNLNKKTTYNTVYK
ncbi:MAG: hypothetical protein CSA42_01270 [Gammaproteobacteria bacterium]|nr:MAG: hypothetical protein CSA42_01270 [Gammaproteobacteria bacterium]